MEEKSSFRLSLSLVLTALMVFFIVTTGAIVTLISFRGSRQTIEFLISGIMEDTRNRILGDTVNYLYEGSDALEFLAGVVDGSLMAGGNQQIDIDAQTQAQTQALAGFLSEFLENNSQYFSAALTRPNGIHLRAIRMEDGTQSTLRQTPRGQTMVSRFEHQNPDYGAVLSAVRETPVTEAYLPRESAWYRQAAAGRELIWTDAQPLGYLPVAGLSAAIPIYLDDALTAVLSLDIRLSEISRFLGASPALDALTFVADPETATIIALAEGTELIDSARVGDSTTGMMIQPDRFIVEEEGVQRILTADDAPESLVYRALNAFTARMRATGSDGATGSSVDSVALPIRYDGGVYLSSFSTFPEETGWEWGIGMLVPQSVFLDQIFRNLFLTLSISVLVVLIGIAISIVIARTISRPLQQLSMEMRQVEDFELDDSIAVQSRLVEVDHMATSLASMKAGLRSFRKYVPAGLVRQLIQIGQEARLGGQEKRLTLFFSDIAGFTNISEKLEPQELVSRLAEYLGALSDMVERHGGTVDKYIGDAIMAFWGAPSDLDNPELRGVEAALACQAEAKRISAKWQGEGLDLSFHIRIGVNTGDLIVGNMGSENRLNYTVIGDAVNLASRLEGANKHYGTEIMVAETTYEAISGVIACRIIDRIRVKGKSEPITVYEPLGRIDELNEQSLSLIRMHNEAWQLYQNTDFRSAAEQFRKVYLENGKDALAGLYFQRCKRFLSSPPGDDWNGVHVLKEK